MRNFMTLNNVFFLLFLLPFISPAIAQVEQDSELFQTLKTNDSLLFEQGYNSCDITVFEELINENFEFYHDKAGITHSKDDFMESIRLGVCKPGSSKDPRVLVPGSLEVYPMYENGILYAAIQKGLHRFGNTTARFTHLWVREGDIWRVSRVLSYDHVED
jgi:hypothetical protein